MEVGNCALSLDVEELPPANPLAVVAIKRSGKFTSETSREMARRALLARAANKVKRMARLNAPLPVPVKAEEYVEKRISQVRAQIDALNAKLERTKEPRDLKFIAESIVKMSELERVLSGRPSPGQFRPKSGKSAPDVDRRTLAEPLDA